MAPEVLHALLEVCAECEANAEASSLPTMGLALHACMRELRQLGVTHAPVPNEAASRLAARETELVARVDELEGALRQWDEAAAPTAGTSSAPALSLDAPQADARLAALPAVPPLHAQLAELGVLAGLCAAQVDAVSRQALEATQHAEHERRLLGLTAKQTLFRDYVKVDEPKDLIRGILG